MKEFLPYRVVRDNGLLLARKMYDEGYVPDIMYVSMRGGAYLGNVINEFFKLAYKKTNKILFSTVAVHSYSGINESSDVVLEGWTFAPEKLKPTDKILLVDDIFDSGETVNFLVCDLIRRGISKDNIKVAVHDYKYFHNKKEPLEIQPDYWCRKHDIYKEEDNVWIHYMSHELAGLSAEELEEHYFKQNPSLRAVFDGVSF